MTDAELKTKLYFAANQSMLMQRLTLDGAEGMLMDGRRDLYESAGYPKILDFKRHFRAMYERGGIATRAVNAPADESWRKLPIIFDGNDAETGVIDSDFCKAWNEIAKRGINGRGLYHYLHRLDRISGVGRFGVLYFGLSGTGELTQPVSGVTSLRYVTVLDEGSVDFGSVNNDRNNQRFGLPETYKLTVASEYGLQRVNDDNHATSQTLLVHHSRVLHVAEDSTTNDLFGTPRLQSIYNYLVNLLKILAGSGEAAWKLMDSGNLFTTADNYELPRAGTSERTALEEQVENHWNGLTRGLLAEGLAPMAIGGTVPDPSNLVTMLISLMSATIDMPQRILMGSERGELASSQDSIDWLESIEERRQNHVAPIILRPIVERFIEWGILPKPMNGFGFKWDRLVKEDKTQGATVASSMANALNAMGIDVEPEEFVRVYAPDIDQTKIGKKEIPPQLDPMLSNPLGNSSVDTLGKMDAIGDPAKAQAKALAANIAEALWVGY